MQCLISLCRNLKKLLELEEKLKSVKGGEEKERVKKELEQERKVNEELRKKEAEIEKKERVSEVQIEGGGGWREVRKAEEEDKGRVGEAWS